MHDLFAAIHDGDLSALTQGLAAGGDASQVREYTTAIDRHAETGSESLLQAAVAAGRADMVALLLRHGADPDHRDAISGRTALVHAAACGHADLVDLLLAHGADTGLADTRSGVDALSAAICGRHLAIARRLLAAGIGVSSAAISAAIWSGDPELLDQLQARAPGLDAGAGLVTAAMAGQAPLVRRLLAQGADVATEGAKALLEAANAGKAEAVAELLRAGAPVDARTEFGWPALHCAAYNGDAATVRALLQAGADPTALCDGGRTADSWAEENGKHDHVTLLRAAIAARAGGHSGAG